MSELSQHDVHVGTCGFSHLLVGCDTCVRMASRGHVGCTCAYSLVSSGPFSSEGKVDGMGPWTLSEGLEKRRASNDSILTPVDALRDKCLRSQSSVLHMSS